MSQINDTLQELGLSYVLVVDMEPKGGEYFVSINASPKNIERMQKAIKIVAKNEQDEQKSSKYLS